MTYTHLLIILVLTHSTYKGLNYMVQIHNAQYLVQISLLKNNIALYTMIDISEYLGMIPFVPLQQLFYYRCFSSNNIDI